MIRHTLNLLAVLIILLQHSAWASGFTPAPSAAVESMVETYNSLSQEERAQEIITLIESRSATDAAYLKQYDLKQVRWPDLKYENGELTFNFEKRSVTFTTDENFILLKGQRVEFAPGKLEQSAKKLAALLTVQTTSIFDLVIPSAHALLPLVGLIMAALAIAVTIFVVAPAINMINTTRMKLECFQLQRDIGEYDSASLTPAEASTINATVNRILERTTTTLRQTNCQREPALCRELQASKRCYEFVQSQVNERIGNVNDSDRGWGVRDLLPTWLGGRPAGPQGVSQ